MSTPRPSLADITQRAEDGTVDVWVVKCPVCGASAGRPCYGCGDMPLHMTHHERITASAAMRTAATAAMSAAIREVLALHQEHEDTGKCIACTSAPYSQASVPWPCPTVRSITPHIDITGEGDHP